MGNLTAVKVGAVGLAGVAAVLLGNPVRAATAQEAQAAQTPQAAVWTPKELRFTYQGFTTQYSCDGLRDKVRQALLELGARKDLQVRATACSVPDGRPSPFPGVTIKMHVLTPAPADQAAGDAASVPAQWQKVELLKGENGLSLAGNCELMEQIKQRIVPLFTARNVELKTSCIPHQLQPDGGRLRAEVLTTDQKVEAKVAGDKAPAG